MNDNLVEREKSLRKQVIETSLKLLDTNLVARTWGNVSGRLDNSKIIITPSGLDYKSLNDDDLPILDYSDGSWTGKYKPSGEKLVHKVAYERFPDVDFVIHTHQTYATAIGLAGFDTLDISKEEKEKLGGIAMAGYGLSGTKTLEKAVAKAMESGAHTIFMVHHGVLIAGSDEKDAIDKALLLEEICKRNCKADETYPLDEMVLEKGNTLKEALKKEFPFSNILQTPQAVLLSKGARGIIAQIDDMAQMIGRKAPLSDSFSSDEEMKKATLKAMSKHQAVLVPDVGIATKADNDGDLESLMILMQKAAIAELHTRASGKNKPLGTFETALMHFVYCKKYSKQKKED